MGEVKLNLRYFCRAVGVMDRTGSMSQRTRLEREICLAEEVGEIAQYLGEDESSKVLGH